jgi:adenylate cyclase
MSAYAQIVKHRKQILTGTAFATAAAGLTLVLFYFSFFRVLELKSYDAMMRLRSDRESKVPIVIVAIDEQTIRTYAYPLAHGKLGSVLAIAEQHGAIVIGVDEILTTTRSDSGMIAEDNLLLNFSALLPNIYHVIGPFVPNDGVVGSTKELELDPEAYRSLHRYAVAKSTAEVPFPRALYIDERPFDSLATLTAGVGHILLRPDTTDGVIRSLPFFVEYDGEYYPALGPALAFAFLHQDMHTGIITPHSDGYTVRFDWAEIPLTDRGDLLVDFKGQNTVFPVISFSDVIDAYLAGDNARLNIFKNAIVIIGATARAIGDHNATPISDISPNCYVHANVADQIISNKFIRHIPGGEYLFILLGLGILVGILTQLLQARWSLFWAVALIITYPVIAFLVFILFELVLPVSAPLIGMALSYILGISYNSSEERRRKAQIKGMFQKYVDVSIVDQMIENPSLLKLGGADREITTMFADVQGFTRLAEQLDPQKTVGILNTYFTDISHFVLENKGTLDKYIGDALMAFWGAPLDDPDHAYHACAAALAMQQFIGSEYKKTSGFDSPLIKQRIGLNTGRAVVGNMGSESKFNYTAIGDSVNLASRLSGVNKEYGTNLLMTEYTYSKIRQRVIAREIDHVLVLGKTKPVKMYELLALSDDAQTEECERRLLLYQNGLDAYKRREWKTAISYFRDVLKLKRDDMVSHLYIQRSLFFIEEPPPDDWNGIFVMTRK